MSAHQKPQRWRKVRTDSFKSDIQYELWQGTSKLATVAQTTGGWYFYGRSRSDAPKNTASEPVSTLDEAKDAARAWVNTD